MPCLLLVLALLVPRAAIVLVFLFTPWFDQVFATWFWPLLGLIFLPYSTLAYTAAVLNTGGTITPGWLVVMVVAVLADLGHWGGGYHSHRRRHKVIVLEP